MVCIHCGSETHVINSRHQKRRNQVWRRRECITCRAVFTTSEQADYGAAWAVAGPNSALTPFSRDKLFLSLYKSLQHRPTAQQDASNLADTITQKIAKSVQEATLTRLLIIQTVQVALSRFDQAASTHYAAFHRN